MPSRTEFQQLADVRVAEAAALLAAGLWSGAYYVAGYAVEFGLKACVLAHVERTGAIFDDKKYSEKCWTHDPEILIVLAGLKADWDAVAPRGSQKQLYWDAVTTWTEQSRYKRYTQTDAQELFTAITDATHGVLTWIRTRW